MCGLAGFTGNINYKESLIKKMTRKIAHRGPDEEGYFIDSKVSLGHRRLSIIDIKGGAQPITKNGYTIIFNGEIYNYKELQRNLIEKGHVFNTDSDTEVLLTGYIEYGEKVLDMLNGMFSFAIYNKDNDNIFISVDRLGIKPLYYYVYDHNIIFGSEIKVILEHPEVKRKINVKIINSYFQYRYILGNETFFRKIYKLLPGTYINFNIKCGDIGITKYWDLEVCSKKEDLGEKYYIQQVESLINKSIERRMQSEVPFGAYLSGGLDSSLIAAIMTKKSQKSINTYSIGFPEEGFNEFKHSQKISKYIKSQHTEIVLEGEKYMEIMEKLISFKDAPLSVPNEVALYHMSKILKKDITVVLSGEGADELFGGYGRIFKSYIDFTYQEENSYMDLFLSKYNYISNEHLELFLSSQTLSSIKSEKYTKNIFTKIFTKIDSLNVEDKIPYIFQKLHLPGLLERVDITTMATGVEARVPFVDHSLVEYVNKMPFKYKISWNTRYFDDFVIDKKLKSEDISETLDTPKYLLKKIAEKYIPKDVIYRKKVGFPVPLDKWFQGDLKKYAQRILLDNKTLERGIYDKTYLKSEDWLHDLSGMNIWMMINLELFFRQYFD